MNLLLRRVRSFNPESTDVNIALVSELGAAQVPSGIFTVRKCGELEPEFVPAKDSTLQNELDRISRIKPQYQWVIDDGVFNFFPKYFAPSPLDISIAEFKVENEPVLKAYRQLFEAPDVKIGFSRLALHEPTFQLIFGGGDSPIENQKRITLDLRNTTLRQASNAIVRADGSKTWILSVYSCRGDNTYHSVLVN